MLDVRFLRFRMSGQYGHWRLRPQKLVRMANFGMIDELLNEPSIWYCQGCRRCLQICPNTVKPSELISHIRRIALERHIFSVDTVRTYRMLFARFQRARKQAVVNCLRGKLISSFGSSVVRLVAFTGRRNSKDSALNNDRGQNKRPFWKSRSFPRGGVFHLWRVQQFLPDCL